MNINLLKLKLINKYPSFAKFIKVNYGIDLKNFDAEEGKDSHYIFGAYTGLNKKILMPNGNWKQLADRIEAERQSGSNIETMNCTVFGALNTIEMLMLHKFNKLTNWSDRYIGIRSGTSRSGNLPTRVLDTIRKYGLLPEGELPNNIMRFSWSEYYSFSGALKPESELDTIAKQFLSEYEIGYETVYPTIPAMKEALKYSPLYVAGYAWAYANGYYQSYGSPNHCFSITNIEQAIAYKTAYDSYDPFVKKLASTYQIYYPKIIVINKKGAEYNYQALSDLVKKGVKFLFRAEAKGEVYKVEKDKLTKLEPQEFLDLNIKEKAITKELLPVNEDYYNNLLI